MTGPDDVFRALALCTQRPGQGLVDARLSVAAAALFSPELLDAAEHHGLDTLLFAHVRASGLTTADAGALDRLRARHVQQSHACAVRQRVMAEVLSAMERAGVRLLVLKGAAFAQLAYADPRLRPMRDVDLLVHTDDLRRCLRPAPLGVVPLGGTSRSLRDVCCTFDQDPVVRTPAGERAAASSGTCRLALNLSSKRASRS